LARAVAFAIDPGGFGFLVCGAFAGRCLRRLREGGAASEEFLEHRAEQCLVRASRGECDADAGGGFNDARPELDETSLDRCELGAL